MKSIPSLLKKPVFEKGNADWLSELPSVIKKYNNTIHSSTEMTAIQASKKSNEKKSIQISKTREKNKHQNINWDNQFVRLRLNEFLVKMIQQIFHINYIQ